MTFWEARDGTIWILCQQNIYILQKNGELEEKVFSPTLSKRFKIPSINLWLTEENTNLIIGFNDSAFFLKNDELVFYKLFPSKINDKNFQLFNKTNRPLNDKISKDIIRVDWENGYSSFISTVGGAFQIDSATLKIKEIFLPDKGVTNAITDFEQVNWFSTLGDGVFKLPSKYALTYTLFDGVNSGNEVFSISSKGDSILTGHGGSTLVVWNKNGKKSVHTFEKYLPVVENSRSTNRLKAIYPLSNGKWLLGFDAFLILWDGAVRNLIPLTATKTIALTGDSIALIATGQRAISVDLKKFEIKENIWQARTTCAMPWNGSNYIGTLNGLYRVNSANESVFMGNIHPSLQRRIVGISETKNSIWVATSDSGLVEINSSGIVRALSEKDGLSSNICRSLVIKDSIMLVGTNKGLNRVDIGSNDLSIIIYNSFNLLPSNAVSSLFLNDNQIFVGSPSGLTVFQESNINSASFCNIEINTIRSTDSLWKYGDVVVLPYNANKLEINYSGISMKSAGDIDFYYKLEGLETEWNQTNKTDIVYNGLPPGNYTFKIYAINRFGAKSRYLKIEIEVRAPFWKSSWFLFFLLLLLSSSSILFLSYRNRQQRKKNAAENLIQKQLATLEQKALQAQMNPHFIFNSLNSIQQYVLTNNVEDANRFLTIFAGLIRETMENSTSGKISLNKDIAYLEKYLALEKMRFGNSFNYQIKIEGIEEIDMIEIPFMLLQPYVENAVRHGVRYLKYGEGLIELIFEKNGDVISCRIRDNGMGREASSKIKSKQHIEYQSRGMELTQRRTDILNKLEADKIDIHIVDIIDSKGSIAGTEVIITIKQPDHDPEN
jgi:hypothetical protein